MRRFVHRVLRDESVEFLEKRYNMTHKRFFDINKMDSVYEGAWVVIEEAVGEWYVVQPFDTISSIAKKLRVSESVITEYNNIEEVFIGMKIFIKK